jgi:hypothetical protein
VFTIQARLSWMRNELLVTTRILQKTSDRMLNLVSSVTKEQTWYHQWMKKWEHPMCIV